MEKIRNERLAGWGEQAARSIPITGGVSGRSAARHLQAAIGRVLAKSQDPQVPAWYADNEYLTRREGELAVRALKTAGRLRRGPGGAALIDLCAQLAAAGPITEERTERFFTGARRIDELPESEAALVGACLRAAVLYALGEEDVDTAQAAELFTSLRTLAELDLTEALETSDPVDALLRQDGVYPLMDEASRAMYRARCQRLAKKHGCTALKEAQTALDAGLHQYLFPPIERTCAWYIAARCAVTACLALAAGALTASVWTALLTLLPLSELVRVGLDSALLRLTPPRRLPRLALEDGAGARAGRCAPCRPC